MISLQLPCPVHTTIDPTNCDTDAADQTHRRDAIIEILHANHMVTAVAHLPSGKFTANAAWVVYAVTGFNLTRSAL